MKFVLASEHTYWWPVTVRMPDPAPGNAGEMLDSTFKMQFVAIGLDAARDRQKLLAALPVEERLERQHDQLIDACRGWEGVVDENDRDVAFDQAALRMAMQQPWFRLAVYEAYEASLSGRVARQGN